LYEGVFNNQINFVSLKYLFKTTLLKFLNQKKTDFAERVLAHLCY